LRRTSLCPGGGLGFQLDNGVEAWFISVDFVPSRLDGPVPPANRLVETWLDNPVHPARLFEAICAPVVN
jgi:hypothetical protein